VDPVPAGTSIGVVPRVVFFCTQGRKGRKEGRQGTYSGAHYRYAMNSFFVSLPCALPSFGLKTESASPVTMYETNVVVVI
jgi:hypothetical protein